MSFESALFRHEHPIRVRTFHVDRQNVVHNIWYFFFLEEARVEYLRALGFPLDSDSFVNHSRFYVARNSCDYISAAVFDEELLIRTRISAIGVSSVTFEHIIETVDSGRRIAEASHVLVHVDVGTDRPSPVPEEMRERVRAFENRV